MVAAWMRRKWPRDTFIEESILPYGSDRLGRTWGQPDILRIRADGGIHIVEVKKLDNPELRKRLVLGQLTYYTFLIDTQHFQDCNTYEWMKHLVTHGLHSQSKIDAIENRFKRRQRIVESWCVVIAGGVKKSLERDDRLWHMHDYVNENVRSDSTLRPMVYYMVHQRSNGVKCERLNSWFAK